MRSNEKSPEDDPVAGATPDASPVARPPAGTPDPRPHEPLPDTPASSSAWPFGWHFFLATAILAALAIGLFADVLFGPAGRVASRSGCDIVLQFVPWRTFGVRELARGHFPLWIPNLLGGMPFFGNSQTAMLYPANAIYLFLSVASATNWILASHVFLGAWLMMLWCRSRGVGVLPAAMAGVIYVSSGAFTLHILPGHLTYICSAAWIPLVFWAVDESFAESRGESLDGSSVESCVKADRKVATFADPARWLAWPLVGAGALAMMLLCGWPQFAFYTPVAAGLYTILRLPAARRRWRAAAAVMLMIAWAGAIAAVQLGASADFAAESTRSGGLSFPAAGEFALPPENLLTMLAPNLLGDGAALPYFGRWLNWEVSVTIGVGGLALAVYGAIFGDRRRKMFSVSMAVACAIASMGPNTPVFYLLYRVPGFDHFRSTGRLQIFTALFGAMLAGLGAERLRRDAGDRATKGDESKQARSPVSTTGAPAPSAQRVRSAQKAGTAPGTRFTELLDAVNRRLSQWHIRPSRAAFVAGVGVAGVLLLIAAARFSRDVSGELAGQWIVWIRSHNGQVFPDAVADDPRFPPFAAAFVARQLLIAGASVLAAAALIAVAQRWRAAAVAAMLLAAAEAFAFSARMRQSTDAAPPLPPAWSAAIARQPADRRVMNLSADYRNAAATYGFSDVAGYDPLPLRRTRDALVVDMNIRAAKAAEAESDITGGAASGAALPGAAPRDAAPPDAGSPILRLMRCGLLLDTSDSQEPATPGAKDSAPSAARVIATVTALAAPMPHLKLFGRCRVMSPGEVLAAISSPTFEPETTLLLESPPDPAPVDDASARPTATGSGRSSASGDSATLVRQDSDHLEIVASVGSPKILLITDPYSTGWRVVDLRDRPIQRYVVQPADHTVRAIALAAGSHHFILEYSPWRYRAGRIVSIAATAAYLMTALALVGARFGRARSSGLHA
jgi:hypothetical protein